VFSPGTAVSPNGTRTLISTDGVRPSITITGPETTADVIAVPTDTAADIADGRRLGATSTSTATTTRTSTGATDTVTRLGEPDSTDYAYTGDLDELPATASKLPIAALLGLLAVAAIFTVRFLRS
jgi:hypothetical protein